MLKACYFQWLPIKTQHSAAYVQTNFESELIIQKYFWKRKIRRTPLGIVIDPRRTTEKKSSCKRVYLGSRKRLFRTIEIRIHASCNNNNALHLKHTHTHTRSLKIVMQPLGLEPPVECFDQPVEAEKVDTFFRNSSQRGYLYTEHRITNAACEQFNEELFLVTLYDSSSSSWYFHVELVKKFYEDVSRVIVV